MLARVAMGTGQLHGKVLSNVIYCYGKGSQQLKKMHFHSSLDISKKAKLQENLSITPL